MKTSIFSIITFFTVTLVTAQTFGTVNTTNVGGGGGASNAAISYLMSDVSNGDQKRRGPQADIQGTAYTSDSFLPAKLLYKDEVESTVFYRYNAYAEEIEIKKTNSPGAEVQGLHRDKDIYVRQLDGKTMSFKTFIDKNGLTQNGYLTSLVDGNYKFYKRVDIKYTEGQKAQNSFVKAIPARFAQFTEYYLEVPGRNRIDEINISNRWLIKQMPKEKQITLKNHLKTNKIKVKDEADIITVLNWLNAN